MNQSELGENANESMLDAFDFIIEESRAIREDLGGSVWSRDGLAHRMIAIENLARAGIAAWQKTEHDKRFEFSTEGIDPAKLEPEFVAKLNAEAGMSEAEIASFWE